MSDAQAVLPGCTDPQHIDQQTDITAYISGEGRPEFIAHLPQCSFCRVEVAQFEALEKTLQRELQFRLPVNRQDCPDIQLLTDYTFDWLDGSAKAELERHLASCSYCPAEYDTLQESLSEPALPQFQPSSPQANPPNWRTLIARLVPRLTTDAPAFGVRGNAPDQPAAPLEYQVEDVTIVLHLEWNARQVNLNGLVSQPDYRGGEARLLTGETVLANEVLDETGSFLFEVALHTDLNLQIQLEDKLIVIPSLSAGT